MAGRRRLRPSAERAARQLVELLPACHLSPRQCLPQARPAYLPGNACALRQVMPV